MRAFVSAVLLIFLSLVWIVPASAMMSADQTQIETVSQGDIRVDKMDCCERSGSEHQSRHMSCAMDCYYLTTGLKAPVFAVLISTKGITTSSMRDTSRKNLLRPPISI